ncbi:unannotated protein [freshwater metagenome]|uniref:Unannotated protein n=1 Tax=freshwater metagenome TaxID=449393 RepID=A0A6J7IST4_9ZZZZ|nr:glycosyltransferase [Actinomycetota bacterium]
MARVLHVNHTAVVSGAERSLLALLDHTDAARVAGVCCPPGPLATQIEARGLPWFETAEPHARFDASPTDRLAAVSRLARIGPAVERAARRTKADVVHANSVRTALGLSFSTSRIVAHVRDVLPPGRTATSAKRVLVARSARIVGISSFVASRFSADLARPGRWVIIDNPIDLRDLPVRDPETRPQERGGSGFDPHVPLALVIGQITPWKRQLLAIEAVAAAHEQGMPVGLAIVGSVKFTEGRTGETNRAYERLLRRRAVQLGVERSVSFLGERDDVGRLMGAADLVLIPSRDEPFGRTAAEAIASGVPVLTSTVGGPADVVARCGGGVVVSDDEPNSWASEIVSMVRRASGAGVGVDPRAIASVRSAFDADRHAEEMGRTFDDVAAGR